MGYSISTPFENEQEKRRMWVFMQAHYRPIGELLKTVEIESFDTMDNFPITEDVSYGTTDEAFILGCDYGAGNTDEERGYFYGLCFFMSVMNGKRKDFGTHPQKPYIVYDGIEEWVLFVNEQRDNAIESITVNEFGYRELPELSLFKKRMPFLKKANPFIKELTKVDALICAELQRLHHLWHEQRE